MLANLSPPFLSDRLSQIMSSLNSIQRLKAVEASSDQTLKNAFAPPAHTRGVGGPALKAAKPPPGYLKAAAPLSTNPTSEAKDIDVHGKRDFAGKLSHGNVAFYENANPSAPEAKKPRFSSSKSEQKFTIPHQVSVVTASQSSGSGLSPSGLSVHVPDIPEDSSLLMSEEEMVETWIPLIDNFKDPRGINGSVSGTDDLLACGNTARPGPSRLCTRSPAPPADAAARLKQVFQELRTKVYALHEIGDYPGKESDFDGLNSIVANMEAKMDHMDDKTKMATAIETLNAENTQLAKQLSKKDETILFLTAAKKDLERKLDRLQLESKKQLLEAAQQLKRTFESFQAAKSWMNDLKGELAKIKEATEVGMNGNEWLVDDLLNVGVPRGLQGATV